MVLTTQQKYQLRKFLKEISSQRAIHTELVTVYVPSGYDLNKIINHLYDEQSTASNIKSAGTRKNVQGALEKMIQHLRVIGKTPENGLVIFSGNVASKEGKDDFRVWSLEPPVPLKTRIYRCDKTFVTDILDEMLAEEVEYGLIVMDRRDANIALLRGKTIVPLAKTHSQVPGKFRAGGQSAQRFHRLIEGAAKDHYKKVAEYVKEQFLHRKTLKGIIVGGPGPTKYDFLELGQLTTELKDKVIAIKDLSYTGEFGLQELVDKSEDVLAQEAIADEKKIMNQFFTMLAKEPGKVSYGKNETEKALKMGAVDTLLLSETIDEKTIEDLTKIAEEMSSKVALISVETREGVQLKDLGGIAAILRYAISG
ncbi:peptide chain release factor aRF-1 [Candidatus Woesearchaeota archaeon]|nr:peptide chain release factor aRF-1 [Candidatus Woesearchaeota archaeon]